MRYNTILHTSEEDNLVGNREHTVAVTPQSLLLPKPRMPSLPSAHAVAASCPPHILP